MASKKATNADLKATCEIVLYQKSLGYKTSVVNGVTFDDNIYDGDGGRCQENARKAYEATTGKDMPGKACCAGKTCTNLMKGRYFVTAAPFNLNNLKVGDFIFLSGGPKCKTCGTPVGHVMIYLGNNRFFQHTSRDGLGITQEPPTTEQKKRFRASFRLLPLA